MKEIVKVLLQEGIDEETIHEVLDVIQEKVGEKIYATREARKTSTDKAKEEHGYNSPEHQAAQAKEIRNDELTHNKIMRDGTISQKGEEVYNSNGGHWNKKGNQTYIKNALRKGYTLVDKDGKVRKAQY